MKEDITVGSMVYEFLEQLGKSPHEFCFYSVLGGGTESLCSRMM